MLINTNDTNVLIVVPCWILNRPAPVLDTQCTPRCYLRRTSEKNIVDLQFSKTVMWVLITCVQTANPGNQLQTVLIRGL